MTSKPVKKSTLLPRPLICLSTCALLAFAALPLACIPGQAEANQAQKPLRGSIEENSRRSNPGLSRTEIPGLKPGEDPFATKGDEEEPLEAPDELRKAPKVAKPPAPPKKPFPLRAETQGTPMAAAGQPQNPLTSPFSMDGLGDDVPEMPPPQNQGGSPITQAQSTYNPNDPDSSPDMQLAWDEWHKRVAATIFTRFNYFAKAAFKRSPPIAAKVSYVVTRDGRVGNLQWQMKSPNPLFNALIYQSVKSLDGEVALLQFPMGSRRQWVPKWGTFTQNYGQEGFKYTKGDAETIKQNSGP